jgi:hypothetical protein
MLPDVQTLVCKHVFCDCLETEIFSDKTSHNTNLSAHIALVHLVPPAVQMFALVSKAWLRALNEQVDRQAEDKVPNFLANSVLDGLELCHCNQYPDPWDMVFGKPEDSELLHTMQVGGDLIAFVTFTRKRNELKRHVLTIQYGAKSTAAASTSDKLSPELTVVIPTSCWVPDELSTAEIRDVCIDWYEHQREAIADWLYEQHEALA